MVDAPVTAQSQDSRIDAVVNELFANDGVFAHRGWRRTGDAADQPADYLIALPEDPREPRQVFDQLRFGGQFVFITEKWAQAKAVARQFGPEAGFHLEKGPASITVGKKMVFLNKQLHYVLARKTELIPPGEVSHHFTFAVNLVPHAESPSGYAVQKTIPSPNVVFRRLKEKYPDAGDEKLAANSRQLVDKVFPVLLTREVAFLKLLQRDLPPVSRTRIPKVLDYQQGPDGLVDNMVMNWLRQGGNTLTQLEFAKQATQLLQHVHDLGRIIHLDMRLDNILITEQGVCIIDFGNAVRIGEEFSETSMLKKIFGELMHTSGVQKVMGKLIETGRITSSEIVNAHQKLDPQADLFYLTLQFMHLHKHPDFQGLIDYDPEGPGAQAVKELCNEVMRPQDPHHPTLTTAQSLLKRLEKIDADVNDDTIALE